MLNIEQLRVNRGGKAVLHEVDLQVRPGAITALLGANGAGKSSTVLALGGLLPIQSGQIVVNGVALRHGRPEWVRTQGVSIVPEGHQVLSDLTVRDNLQAAATALPASEVASALENMRTIFPELRAKLDLPGRSLSGGQKQMVCLAQALITSPKYLIVDELSLGLAPAIVKRLTHLLVDIAHKGVGVLLIEQFTTLALSVAQDAYVMTRGRIAFRGSAEQLVQAPDILHKAYLGS